jgi:hypothetical protein
VDVPTLAGLLREAAEHHHPYEASGPEHDWADWYAAYIGAREEGRNPDEASEAGGRYVESML